MPGLIPRGHPARRAAGAASVAMDAASFLVTFAAVCTLAWGAKHLLDDASSYFAKGGGWDFVAYVRTHATGVEGIKLLIPGLHVRAAWFAMAWVCLVFGTGCLLLTVAGARSLWWRLHGLLRSA